MTILEVYIDAINNLISEFDDKYNIHSGGDGMIAIFVSEFLDRTGNYPNVVACYKNDVEITEPFTTADHYMVVVAGLEINKPMWEPKRVKNKNYTDCKEIFYANNGEYNHIHDLEFLRKLYEIT